MKLKSSSDNRQARMNFVSYWAEYVRTHSDQEWGEQQRKLINSHMQAAKFSPLTPKEYLKLKSK
jgi:hypothetical protein